MVTVAIYFAFNDEWDIGKIFIKENEHYDSIINKINCLLHKHHLVKITDFHYVQEDGDISYVNKQLINLTDLYDAIKYDTTFYVYYDDSL
jgi:hypothetical protein